MFSRKHTRNKAVVKNKETVDNTELDFADGDFVSLFFDEIFVAHRFCNVDGAFAPRENKKSVGTEKPPRSGLAQRLNDADLDPDLHEDEKEVLRRVSERLCLSSDLLKLSPTSGFSSFLSLLDRRLKILTHAHHCLKGKKSDEKCQDEPSTPSEKRRKDVFHGFSSSSYAGSSTPMVRMALMSLFPMIQSLSKTDPKLQCSILGVLTNILETLPRLSLRHSPSDCLNSFRDLIQQLTLTTTSLTNDDFKDTPSTEVVGASEQGLAASALIGFALQEGSLKHTLASLITILKLQLLKLSDPTIQLSVLPYLSQLQEHAQLKDKSVLSKSSFLESWQHKSAWLDHKPQAVKTSQISSSSKYYPGRQPQDPFLRSSSSKPVVSSSHEGSIACNGSFLYAHHSVGSSDSIIKIGTGYGGTIRGHIYNSRTGLVDGQKFSGTLLWCSQKLIFCPHKFSHAVEEKSPKFSKIVEINEIDGKGLELGEEYTVVKEDTQPLKQTDFLSMCSDGQNIYALYSDSFDAEGNMFVDVFSVSPEEKQLIFEHTVELQEEPQQASSPFSYTQSSKKKKTQNKWKTFCTGLQYVRYSWDSRAQDSLGDIFCIKTGEFLSRPMPSYTSSQKLTITTGTSCCYDPSNDLIWDYEPNTFTVQTFLNFGSNLKPSLDPELQRLQLSEEYNLENLSGLLPSGVVVLHNLAFLCEKYNTSKNVKWKKEHTACIEIEETTFIHILTILSLCHQHLIDSRSEWRQHLFHIVHRTIKILRHNLHHAVGTAFTTENCAATFSSIKDLLIDLSKPSTFKTESDFEKTIHSAIQHESLSALMAGLPYFYPTASDLVSLLSGPWKKELLVLESLIIPSPSDLEETPLQVESLSNLLQTEQDICEAISDTGFLNALLSQVQDENLDNLKHADHINAPILSPGLRLLLSLQRYIFANNSGNSKAVLDYGKVIIKLSSSLLDRTTTKLRESGADGRGQQINSILKSSIVGVLLPSLISVFSSVDFHENKHSFTSLVGRSGPLVKLLKLISDHNALLKTQDIDRELLNKTVLGFSTEIEDVESKHPYPNGPLNRTITMKGAVSLSLTFDAQCSSQGRNDHLTVTDRNNANIVGPCYGASLSESHWPSPTSPIIVEGNTVKFQWHSDSYYDKNALAVLPDSSSRWGFKCTVRGFKPSEPLKLPWLLDCQHSVAVLAAKCARAQVFEKTPKDGLEAQLAKWLDSELFSQGLGQMASGSSAEMFLQDIIQNKGEAATLLSFMENNTSGRATVPNAAREAIPHAERVIIACQLHHSNLVESAVNLAMKLRDDCLHFALLNPIWERTNRILRQLVALGREEKAWQDFILNPVPYSEWAPRKIGLAQSGILGTLCDLKGVQFDGLDVDVTCTRLYEALREDVKYYKGIDIKKLNESKHEWEEKESVQTPVEKLEEKTPKEVSTKADSNPPPTVTLKPTSPSALADSLKSTPKTTTKKLPRNQKRIEISDFGWESAYKTVAEHVIARAEFLLQLASPVKPSSGKSPVAPKKRKGHKRSLSRTLVLHPQLRRSHTQVSIDSDGDDDLSLTRSLSKGSTTGLETSFSAQKSAATEHLEKSEDFLSLSFKRYMSWKQDDEPESESHTMRMKILTSFLLSSAEPSSCMKVIHVRESRCSNRIDGINALNELLTSVPYHGPSTNGLLLDFGNQMREHWSDLDLNIGPHYTHNIEGCGSELIKNLKESYSTFLQNVVGILRGNGSSLAHSSTILLCIDAIMMMYEAPDDVELLSKAGLFDTLRNSMSSTTLSNDVRTAARTSFRQLATICLLWEEDGNNVTLREFQTSIFESLFDELRRELRLEAEEKDQKEEGDSKEEKTSPESENDADSKADQQPNNRLPIESAWCDDASFELLVLVHTLRESSAATKHLGRESTITTLLSLLDGGTLRVQRLAIRLLQYIFTNQDIYSGRSGLSYSDLVQLILDRVGGLLCGTLSQPTPVPSTLTEDIDIVPTQVKQDNRAQQYCLMLYNPDSPKQVSQLMSDVSQICRPLFEMISNRDTKKMEEHKSSIRQQFMASNSAVVMESTKKDCHRFAIKLTERGFVASVIPQQPEDGLLRNRAISNLNRCSRNWRSGHSSVMLTSELVNLVRKLGECANWEPYINDTLTASLKNLSKTKELLEQEEITPEAVSRAEETLACLAILGGFTEVIRQGGRVAITSDPLDSGQSGRSPTTVGTVVQYERGRKDAKVIFDHDVPRVATTVSVSRLRPISGTSLSDLTAPFTFKGQILQGIGEFLKSTEELNSSNTDPTQEGTQTRLKSEIRLRCLQALSSLLENKQRCESLCDKPVDELIETLVTIAGKCEPSSKLLELESQSSRIQERVLDLIQPSPSLNYTEQSDSSTEIVNHSTHPVLSFFPYAAQNVDKRLTTCWSAKGAQYCLFEDATLRTVRFGRPEKERENPDRDFFGGRGRGRPPRRGGYGRDAIPRPVNPSDIDEFVLLGNHPVLETLPEFYFEVAISALPAGASLSIGLTPKPPSISRDKELFGGGGFGGALNNFGGGGNRPVPISIPRIWPPGSVRFNNKEGHVIREHDSGDADPSNYSDPYKEGDTVGCGWNLRDNTIYFTKNGLFLGVSEGDAAVSLYPAVGLSKSGILVTANFGQDRFLYDLSDRDLQETEDMKQKRLVRAQQIEEERHRQELEERERQNAQEVAKQAAREEKAQNLLQVCGDMLGHDLRRAVKAVELSNESPDQAVSWLYENPAEAIREIEKLLKEEDDLTKEEAKKEEEQQKAAKENAEAETAESGDAKEESDVKSDGKQTKETSTEVVQEEKYENESKVQYDWKYSQNVTFKSGYDSFLFADEDTEVAPSSAMSQAELEWFTEIEMILRHRQVEPEHILFVMNGLRNGGHMRETALQSISELVPNIPPIPQQADSHAGSLTSARLKIDDLRKGLRVLVSKTALPSFSPKSSPAVVAPQAPPGPSGAPQAVISAGSADEHGSSLWVSGMESCLDRIGTIKKIDYDSQPEIVLIEFDHSETSTCEQWWFTVSALRKVYKNYRDAYIELENEKEILESHSKVTGELANLYARKCVLNMTANSNTFINQVHESSVGVEFSDLLHLAGAETIPVLQPVPKSPFLSVLKNIFQHALKTQPDIVAEILQKCSTMVKDQIAHVDTGFSPVLPHRESPRCISVEGASALIVSFDNSSRLPVSGVYAHLYGNSTCTNIIKRYSGQSPNKNFSPIPPFVALTNKLWFTIEVDQNDEDALTDDLDLKIEFCPIPGEFSLALWMINTLVESVADNAQNQQDSRTHLIPALEALATFLVTPKLPCLVRTTIFQTLARGLRVVPAKQRPSLNSGVFQASDLFCEMLILQDKFKKTSIYPVYFQNLVELIVSYRSVFGETAYESYALKASNIFKDSSKASKAQSKSSKKRRNKRAPKSSPSVRANSEVPGPDMSNISPSFGSVPFSGSPADAYRHDYQIASPPQPVQPPSWMQGAQNDWAASEDSFIHSPISGDGLYNQVIPVPADQDLSEAAAASVFDEQADILVNMGFAESTARMALAGLDSFEDVVEALSTGLYSADLNTAAPEKLQPPKDTAEKATPQLDEKSDTKEAEEPSFVLPWFDNICLISSFLGVLCSRDDDLPERLLRATFGNDAKASSSAKKEHPDWTFAMDVELGTFANSLSDAFNRSVFSLDTEHVEKSHELLQGYSLIQKLDVPTIVNRLKLIQQLNRLLQPALKLIDLSQANLNPWSIAAQLATCRSMIFSSVKNEYIDNILKLTAVEQNETFKIVIDRIVAASARDKQLRSPEYAGAVQHSVFGQAFRQLWGVHPSHLKPPRPSGEPHISFEVKLKGEHAAGAGGLHRAFYTDIGRELHDVHHTENGPIHTVPLLVQSPNMQAVVGDNRDKYVPRPSATSNLHLSMYEFLGMLMGMAVRTGILMRCDVPSFFWKPLVGLGINIKDLEGIDKLFAQGVLQKIKECKDDDEESFRAHFGDTLTYSVILSDKTHAHVVPNGDTKQVTFDKRDIYLEQALRIRLNESHKQILAVKRGLSSYIPGELLSLCTWEELERRVCGKPTVDIDLLKRHTAYGGVDADAPHIAYFWQVLIEFPQEERRKFIKFAWAQERLPSNDAGFNRGGQRIRMLIKSRQMKEDQNPDDAFPYADTCFFNVELPHYSSLEVTRKKISTVINLDAGIDGDNVDIEDGFGVIQDDEEDLLRLIDER